MCSWYRSRYYIMVVIWTQAKASAPLSGIPGLREHLCLDSPSVKEEKPHESPPPFPVTMNDFIQILIRPPNASSIPSVSSQLFLNL